MMKRYKQFDSLVIDDFQVEEWNHPLHNHNHFEIVFIRAGRGIHHLNQVASPYREGDLFLLGPEDEHRFEVRQRSRFTYFKFTRRYLTHHPDLPVPNHWNRDVDRLLHHSERKKGNLLRSAADRQLVRALMPMIVHEYRSRPALHQKIIFQLFSVIMLIIKRNGKAYELPDTPRERSGIAEEIMEYIELNIYDPQKLTLKNLARQFHYSSNYIGLLFKEKVGSSLREYVSHYRYKLIEQRLTHSQISMKQLADEFGFVDESHLHKFVKNRSGKKLSEIRS